MDEELLDVKIDSRFPYSYSMGTIPSFFFRMLRDEKRIFGRRCPSCGKVYIPPRPVCGPCFKPTSEWVEVGPAGTLVAYTVVYFSFLDPMTGKKRPVPYGYGMVKLDKADSRLQHFISESDPAKLRVGMRVTAVFAEERFGNFSDLVHFRPMEE
ncbi:MAG: Zn-ribbon domain-containing OB-fold protein [bacterium]